jgi:hypothetical protein
VEDRLKSVILEEMSADSSKSSGPHPDDVHFSGLLSRDSTLPLKQAEK